MSAVLDASALLAHLQQERGGGGVGAVLGHAVMSTVNWAEVVGKARAADVDVAGLQDDLRTLGLSLLPFSAAQAELAGSLAQRTRPFGLSLGDRACIAVAIERGEKSTRLIAPGWNWTWTWRSSPSGSGLLRVQSRRETAQGRRE